MIQAIKRFYKDKSTAVARLVFLHICSLLTGLFTARITVFGSFMPFGMAVCAGFERSFCISAGAGAIFGSLYPANGAPSMRYIGGIAVILALKLIIDFAYKSLRVKTSACLYALLGSASSAVVLLLAGGASADLLTRYICETLLAVGSAYFLGTAFEMLTERRSLAKLSVEELCAAVISVSILLMSVASFTIYGVSIARIAAVLLLLCAAYFGKETTGAVCAVAFGFAMSAVSDNMYFIVGAYALGGLIAGVFSRLGRLACIVAFLLSNAVMVLGFYETYPVIPELFETALAGVLFLLLPKNALSAAGAFFAPAPALARTDGLRKSVVMRLKFASEALQDVSGTVEEVAGRLRKMNTPSLTDVFVKTENAACYKCGLRIHCFETSKEKTYAAFKAMTGKMGNQGPLVPEDYPKPWVDRCLEPDTVAQTLYDYFCEYRSKQAAEQRIAAIRSAVSDQMDGLSEMLRDMSGEFDTYERYDPDTANRVDGVLRRMGIQPSDVSCRIDRHSRMTVEIRVERLDVKTVNKSELMKQLSAACGKRFDVPCITQSSAAALLTLVEKTVYRVETGVAQYSYKNARLCGDSYQIFEDSRGSMVLVLSDGMGCGGRAAVDSSMAVGLIHRLVKAGFGYECSLKLVNSAMLFKSSDESLATVDITAIDLYSGQTDFFKAGTPETIVLRGNKIGRAGCKTYPAGILRDVQFDKTSTVLQMGDVVVMVSDGATSGGTEWIENEVRNFKRGTAQQLAEHLAQGAARRRDDGHEDDITVLVGKIEKAV